MIRVPIAAAFFVFAACCAGAMSVQNGQLMLTSDKLEFDRGAAAKAKGDDRNNGKENPPP